MVYEKHVVIHYELRTMNYDVSDDEMIMDIDVCEERRIDTCEQDTASLVSRGGRGNTRCKQARCKPKSKRPSDGLTLLE